MSDLLFGLDKKTNKYKPMSLTTTADKVLMDLDKNTLLSTEFKTLKDKVSEIETKVTDIPSATEMNKFIKAGEAKVEIVSQSTEAMKPNILYKIPTTDTTAPEHIKKINRANVYYFVKTIVADNDGMGFIQHAWLPDSTDALRTYSRYIGPGGRHINRWKTVSLPIGSSPVSYFRGEADDIDDDVFKREDITNADNANRPNTMYFLKRGATNSPFPDDDGFIQLEAWNEDGKSYRQIAYSNKSAKRYIRIYRDDAASINWNNGIKYTNWIEDDPSATYVKYFPKDTCTKEFLNNNKINYDYQTTLSSAIEYLGAPYHWVFLSHYGHANKDGYSTQIIIRLDGRAQSNVYGGAWHMMIRTSDNEKWTEWESINNAHNIFSPYPMSDESAITKLSGGIKYYASKQGYIGLPDKFGNSSLMKDGYVWVDWHRKPGDKPWYGNYDKAIGVQWFAGWNEVGLWYRPIINSQPTHWRQFVMGNSDRNFQRVYINNKYDQDYGFPIIDLAVGDHDTGINNIGDNHLDLVTLGVSKLRLNDAGAYIPPESPVNNPDRLPTSAIRNTVISTGDPVNGNNGDIWLKYV